MATSEHRLRKLAGVVAAPEFVVPWLDRIYDPIEIDLVFALADGPLSRAALAERLGLAPADLAPIVSRGYRRAVLAGDGDELAADTFYERSAMWARSAGRGSVPDDVHKALADWWLDTYVDSVRDSLAKLQGGAPEPGGDADYAYLLLSEAEEMVRREEHVYLWRCDCRTLMRACDQSVDNCLRFHNDRDVGLEISKELAIDILREADAAGLMHCDYVGFGGPTDPHAICNCCTDCCQPQLASQRLGVSDVWPRRRYLASAVSRRLHSVRHLHRAMPLRRPERRGHRRRREPRPCRG